MRLLIVLLTFLGAAIYLSSCNSNSEDKETHLIISLIDAPAEYDEVNIDIQGIRIHLGDEEDAENDDDEGWMDLNLEKKGVQNILDFTSGVKLILADIDLPPGYLSQIRLILGDNNSVKIGLEEYDLKTPSAQQSGLKLNVNQSLEGGVEYEFKLDFEAARSIVETGNGKYLLNPVIRVITNANSGAIMGEIKPANLNITIYAMQGSDPISSTFATENISTFLLSGIPQGTYDIVFDPGEDSGLSTLTVSDIDVITGKTTDIGSYQLQ